MADYLDGSNACPSLQQIAAVGWPAQKVLYRGTVGPLLGTAGAGVVDHRGVLLTSAEALLTSPKHLNYMLAWIRDVLVLQGCEGWRRRPPRWLKDLVERFLWRVSNRTVLVDAQASRDLITSRHSNRLQEGLLPHCQPRISDRLMSKCRELILPDGIRVPSGNLRFALQRNGPSEREARFTEIRIHRNYVLVDPLNPASVTRIPAQIDYWCAATPDDKAKLDKGYVPAGLNCLIKDTSVNTARMFAIITIDPRTGECATYGFDFDPSDGRLQSIRKAKAPFSFYTEENPWLSSCLRTAVEWSGHEKTGG